MRLHRHNLRMLAAAAIVITSAGLAGCFATAAPPAPVASAPPRPLKPVDIKPICITVKTYTPAEEQALGAAISALDENNPIIPAMGDYHRMREQARACAAS